MCSPMCIEKKRKAQFTDSYFIRDVWHLVCEYVGASDLEKTLEYTILTGSVSDVFVAHGTLGLAPVALKRLYLRSFSRLVRSKSIEKIQALAERVSLTQRDVKTDLHWCLVSHEQLAKYFMTNYNIQTVSFEWFKAMWCQGNYNLMKWCAETKRIDAVSAKSYGNLIFNSMCLSNKLDECKWFHSAFAVGNHELWDTVFQKVCSQHHYSMAEWLVATFDLSHCVKDTLIMAMQSWKRYKVLFKWLCEKFGYSKTDVRELALNAKVQWSPDSYLAVRKNSRQVADIS